MYVVFVKIDAPLFLHLGSLSLVISMFTLAPHKLEVNAWSFIELNFWFLYHFSYLAFLISVCNIFLRIVFADAYDHVWRRDDGRLQHGRTALMWAARFPAHHDCARMLLDAGADTEATCSVRVL
jgi:hypothetical protein